MKCIRKIPLLHCSGRRVRISITSPRLIRRHGMEILWHVVDSKKEVCFSNKTKTHVAGDVLPNTFSTLMALRRRIRKQIVLCPVQNWREDHDERGKRKDCCNPILIV